MIFVVLFRGERTVAVVVAAFLLFVLLAHLLLPLTRRERESEKSKDDGEESGRERSWQSAQVKVQLPLLSLLLAHI